MDWNDYYLLGESFNPPFSVIPADVSFSCRKEGDPAAGSPLLAYLVNDFYPNHESYLGPLPHLRVSTQTLLSTMATFP